MNTVTKAIAILAVTLMTSACHTKYQSDMIYAQSNAYVKAQQANAKAQQPLLYPVVKQTLPSETVIQNKITEHENNRLNCGDAFKGVADCNIVIGKN